MKPFRVLQVASGFVFAAMVALAVSVDLNKSGSNPAVGGGWTDAGTTVNLNTSTDKVGIGVTNAGTYQFQVRSTDVNTALFENTASNTSLNLEAQTNAYISINGNKNGASSTNEALIFLHNGGQQGFISSDNADSNRLKIDTGNNNTTTSGIVIDTSHRVSVGSVAPATSAKLFVSSATTSTESLSFGGIFATLPTTGYNRGTVAYQTSNNRLFVATETVVSANSWLSL